MILLILLILLANVQRGYLNDLTSSYICPTLGTYCMTCRAKYDCIRREGQRDQHVVLNTECPEDEVCSTYSNQCTREYIHECQNNYKFQCSQDGIFPDAYFIDVFHVCHKNETKNQMVICPFNHFFDPLYNNCRHTRESFIGSYASQCDKYNQDKSFPVHRNPLYYYTCTKIAEGKYFNLMRTCDATKDELFNGIKCVSRKAFCRIGGKNPEIIQNQAIVFARSWQCNQKGPVCLGCNSSGTCRGRTVYRVKEMKECNKGLVCSEYHGKKCVNATIPQCQNDYEFTCTSTGVFPDIYKCDIYYYCSGEHAKAVIENCPKGSYYNAKLELCETFKANRAPPCPRAQLCHDSRQQFAIKENPKYYYDCSDGDGEIPTVVYKCPEGQTFKEEPTPGCVTCSTEETPASPGSEMIN